MRSRGEVLTTVAFSLAFVVGIAALYAARYVVLTGMIGITLGVLLIPVLDGLQRRWRVPRGVGALLVLLAILGGMALVALGIGSMVADQVEQLSQKGPQIVQEVKGRMQGLFRRFPGLQQQLEGGDPSRMQSTVARMVFGGLQSGLAAVAGVMVVLALAIYTSVRSHKYLHGLVSAFPAHARGKAEEVLRECARALREWFGGQLLDMAAVATLTALGLWIIGVDYWIVLGLLAGLLDIVPYVGPVSAALLTTTVTLGTQPELVPWVLGLFVVVQQLEGNVLLPLIMRDRAELPEVPLILLVIALGTWFGLLGALLAAPTLAVSRVIFLRVYRPAMDARGRDESHVRQ